jgi:hypothetical protein
MAASGAGTPARREMRSLRTRINRLALRKGGKFWIQPAAADEDGRPMEAHVFERSNGDRSAFVVPAPVDDADEWARECQRSQAKLRERIAEQSQRTPGAIGSRRP